MLYKSINHKLKLKLQSIIEINIKFKKNYQEKNPKILLATSETQVCVCLLGQIMPSVTNIDLGQYLKTDEKSLIDRILVY